MSYAEHKASWEILQSRIQKLIAINRKPHHVTARDLIQELKLLKYMTGDDRFSSAIVALKENGLTDQNNSWVRKWRKATSQDVKYDYMKRIDAHLAGGGSLREACAQIVDDDMLEHATFEAGVAHVERIWRRAKAEPLDIS